MKDLRMEKVKQKISGCFRTFFGGVISSRIRSYISTARKQGWNIIDVLAEAIRGCLSQNKIERVRNLKLRGVAIKIERRRNQN